MDSNPADVQGANHVSTQTIIELGKSIPDFSTLVSALEKANLVTVLNGTGPFTVFAPDNAAFAALNLTTANLLALPNLGDILKYHVVSGKVRELSCGYLEREE